MENSAEIKKKWDENAKKHGLSEKASWNDLLIHKEAALINKYLIREGCVLDVGCANGFCTVQWVKGLKGTIIGLDYSEKMIEMAKFRKDQLPLEDKKRLSFVVGDILALPSAFQPESVDQIIGKRVITNITNADLQIEAIKNLHYVLKKGHVYICSEPTWQGLIRINKIRQKIGLDKLSPPWHNLYLDEPLFLDRIKQYFRVKKRLNFSSTYYLGSRVFYAWLAQQFGWKLKYDSIFNRISLKLPNFGNFGIQTLFLLERL